MRAVSDQVIRVEAKAFFRVLVEGFLLGYASQFFLKIKNINHETR